MTFAKLPEHWALARVDELGELTLGRQRSPEHHNGPNMRPYLRVANVFENRIDTSDVMEMNFTPDEFKRYRLVPGDVLLNEGQSLHLVGRPALFRGEVKDACFQNTLVRFRAHPGVLPEYALLTFRWFLHTRAFRSLARWTTNIAHLGAARLAEMSMPLAPTGEQRRLVDETAVYESRLDAAVAYLERVQRNLKRYRASVLQAAVEGRLVPTEAELAKKEGRSYEPASKLLERILVERRRQWIEREAEKAVANAKAKAGKRWTAADNAAALDKARPIAAKKYEEPAAPGTDDLPGLPAGWCWATIGAVAECRDHQRVPVSKTEREKRPGNVPYFGANGRVGWIDEALFDEPLVLVVEDETFVGRTEPFSYMITGPAWVNNHAHVLRPTGAVTPEYLNYSLHFYPFTRLTTGTTGRRKLTKSVLMGAPYAIPPLQEQKRIVAVVDASLSLTQESKRSIEKQLTRIQRLRQSILGWAFEGRLVDQDPNDEPATVLLDRIKAERAATEPAKRGAPRGGRQKVSKTKAQSITPKTAAAGGVR